MITSNISTELGLFNGTFGKVVSILYDVDHKPPSLPMAVIVALLHFCKIKN